MTIADFTNSSKQFGYQLLDRLRTDCEYYLGNGGRNKNNLWAGGEKEQIDTMKALWDSFSEEEKPEWLSMEDIIEYGLKMW